MANGTATFDTHRFVTGLVAKKMPKEQAEFLADTYNDLLSDQIVTKSYLKTELALLEQRMTTKFLFMLIGLFVALIGADKILG